MGMSDEPYIIELKKVTDDRGSLVFAEGCDDIPFDIKRIYYIFSVGEEAVRGKHAHKTSDIVLICVSGSCTVTLRKKDRTEKEYILNSPDKGLYVPAYIWREMSHFSGDCVLLAASSEHYDAEDYIMDTADYYE